MNATNTILGTFFHAIGGVSSATCYTPSTQVKKWSWGTFWLTQSFFAWFLMPIVIGLITVPNFFQILLHAPHEAFWGAFLFGVIYGFGGMSFGFAIKHIGYSLTYTISIGISAILGTLVPLIMKGTLVEYFTRPGSYIVISGMLLSIIGIVMCGRVGFKKENELQKKGNLFSFNMTKGLLLGLAAGVLSAFFNVSLELGQPISDIAAAQGVGYFQGNAKLIVSTSGCFLVNMIWFIVLGTKDKTLKEFTSSSGISFNLRFKNFIWSALAGILWCGQFFFYGLAHVFMGNYQFVSWVLHMSMLIFFSYVVGILMKEWGQVSKSTYRLLIVSLFVLVMSFVLISYGSYYGESILSVK
jgi:L-rhamnose-H+ transport protein